jgi:hypothetical protein
MIDIFLFVRGILNFLSYFVNLYLRNKIIQESGVFLTEVAVLLTKRVFIL